MGISHASGVPAAAGLVTGIIGGLLVGALPGSPLQVSGPAAGLTVLVFQIVQAHGLESLGVVVLLAGLLQVVAGYLKLGRWFQAVSPGVVEGMLAGIAILLIVNQVHVMVDDAPRRTALKNLVAIPEAFEKGFPWPELGDIEQRRFDQESLSRIATLHSEQTQVTERVASLVPHDLSPEAAAEVTSGLSELAPRQQLILDQLSSLLKQRNQSTLAATEESLQPLRERRWRAAVEALAQATDDLRHDRGSQVLASQQLASQRLMLLMDSLTNHDWAAKIGLLTLAVIGVWTLVPFKGLRKIPAPVIAIAVATLLSASLSLPVLTVEIPNSLIDDLRMPSITVATSLDWPGILKSAFVVAAVASAETLFCCTAIDQMQSRYRTNYDQVLVAQGAGNVACGLLGGLPMTGVIVRSSANIDNGATSRLSTVLHGAWLLLFAWQFSGLLRWIPASALAAVLVYKGFRLIDFQKIRYLLRSDRGEFVVYFVTVIVVVTEDLGRGVVAGVFVSALRLLFTFTRFDADLIPLMQRDRIALRLRGAATFVRLPQLIETLDRIPADKTVELQVDELTILDHACQEALLRWMQQHCLQGGAVKVHWEHLRVRGRVSETMIEEYRLALDVPLPVRQSTAVPPPALMASAAHGE